MGMSLTAQVLRAVSLLHICHHLGGLFKQVKWPAGNIILDSITCLVLIFFSSFSCFITYLWFSPSFIITIIKMIFFLSCTPSCGKMFGSTPNNCPRFNGFTYTYIGKVSYISFTYRLLLTHTCKCNISCLCTFSNLPQSYDVLDTFLGSELSPFDWVRLCRLDWQYQV